MVLLKKMFFRISNCGTSLKKHEYKTLNSTFFEVLDNRQRMRGFDPALANVELWKLSYFLQTQRQAVLRITPMLESH